jgi:hypothetical protein
MYFSFLLLVFLLNFSFFSGNKHGSRSSTLETYANLVSIILGLIGAYLLALSVKIKSQYSIQFAKSLKVEEKKLIAPTEVQQKNKMFGGV